MDDLIIIGAGPAGISAALYTARGKISTRILASGYGALERAKRIENFYGASDSPSGKALLERGRAQAQALGVPIVEDEVVSIEWDGNFIVKGKSGEYPARCVLLATGASRPAPNIPLLKELEGKGVSYCAVCDGFFYRNKTVAVLGAGAYCAHEASVLAPLAATCYVLTNGEEPHAQFPETCKIVTTPIRTLQQQDDRISAIELQDGSVLPVDGLFVATAQAGASDFARKIGLQTEKNAIVTDADKMTNVPGLFAAGDCTGGLLQVCKAASDGAIAATGIRKYLNSLR